MVNPQSAYYLVEGKLQDYCQKLMNFPHSPFWIHEKVVSDAIGLPTGKGDHGQSEALSALLDCIKKGHGGKQNNRTTTGVAACDLADQRNGSNVCYQFKGAKEAFQRGELAEKPKISSPRWFHFGDDHSFEVGRQLDIVNNLTGNCKPGTIDNEDPDVIPRFCIKRRGKLYKHFFSGAKKECIRYLNYDVPVIAARFADSWDGVQISTRSKIPRRRSFHPDKLEEIEHDFRLILLVSNKVGRLDYDSNSLRARFSLRHVKPRDTTPSTTVPSPAQHPAPEVRPVQETPQAENVGRRNPVSRGCGSALNELPDCLRKASLLCTDEGSIMWDTVSELASLELLFLLHMKDNVVWDSLKDIMASKGVQLPDCFHPRELPSLTESNKTNALRNINAARDDLMQHMSEMFVPAQDEPLYLWLRDAEAYSLGRRIEANNFVHCSGNGHTQLSLAAKFILRHIYFSFNLSLDSVGALWASFYALIMGRVIPLMSFLSSQSIWTNVMSLQPIDNHLRTRALHRRLRKRTKNGFRPCIYLSSDDSKHFKRNHHVLVTSDFEEISSDLDYLSVPFDPTFRLITTSPNEVKSENYKLNADDIIDMLGLEGAAYINGGVNDNAADAQNEILCTVQEILRRVELSDDPNIRDLVYINGVRRRALNFGDSYHIDNLGVMHASVGFAGDTVNGDHYQCHHRQFLMSLHSLCSDDRPYAQAMMDRVMEGRPRVILRTWRERQQRWLVNQRYAAFIISILGHVTSNGVMCLVAWGLFFANNNRSTWKKRVGEEIATWISMKPIVMGLHFEAELGNYFEQSYAWHNRKGPFHSRSGFRMMEMHDQYWEFMLPWWNRAVSDPHSCMPKTMAYIEANFEGEDLIKRRKQVERGLRMGREEVIKMTKRYLLKPPLLLLLLANRKHGPSFLRAVLSVFHENENNVPDDVLLIHQPGESWGKYVYASNSDRPDDEKAWYDLLTSSPAMIDDLIHFWRQFCLNWNVLTGDLQKLSKANANMDPVEDGVSPLTSFEGKYPILFECLYAVFGAMMSNSRLCEQIHGMMRHGLKKEIGMSQADHHRQYSSGIDYSLREARRSLGDGTTTDKEQQKKAKHHQKTKLQQELLSTQLIEKSAEFANDVASNMDPKQIPTVTEIKKAGRRVQDNKRLMKQIIDEDVKASQLTRSTLTVEAIQAAASRLRPTNDSLFLYDDRVLRWRDKVGDLIKNKHWASRDKKKFKDTWRLVRKSFIHIDKLSLRPNEKVRKQKRGGLCNWGKTRNQGRFDWGETRCQLYGKNSIYGKITSYAKAEEFISEYIRTVNKVKDLIYSFCFYNGKWGFKTENGEGFDDKAVQKNDILFYFVRLVEEAVIDENAVIPAEDVLVSSCTDVDPHYTYTASVNTAQATGEHSDDDDDASGDCDLD